MKLNRNTFINIIFFAFIIFLFTPFGLGTRAKLTQGFAYVRTFLFAPTASNVDERVKPGNFNIQLKSIVHGEDISLEVIKGKVVFINYWATWCPPCRGEMPMINKLYTDYKDKIEFVFITSDTKKEVDAFYSKNNYDFPTYNLASNPPKELNTTTLPTTFILDKNGNIALEEYGAADWNSNKVRNLLDDLINE